MKPSAAARSAGRSALDRAPTGAVRAAPAAQRKVLLTTPYPQQRTAWTKARADVGQLLRQSGYQAMELPEGVHAGDWLRLLRDLHAALPAGGHVLIEYPFPHRRRARMLALLARLLRVRLYALLHDLDSLRFPDSPREREITVLRLFDGLIAHNPVMAQWLRDAGIERRIVSLNLFDYRGRMPAEPCHEEGMQSPLKVACCGNLSWAKAGYLYDPRLARLPGVRLDLYGAFFEPARMPSNALPWRGVFEPDAPRLQGRYHFGLVWDGASVECCDGNYGHYMRFNNPHKLSLYVAMGLPAIVWRQSAIAGFVQRCGIGLAVDDLRELGAIAARVSDGDYRQMVRNLAPLSEAVRRGHFLQDALARLLL